MRNGEFIKQRATQSRENYIVEGLANKNRLVLWASIPGEGKSLLNMAMLYHVAYGAPFLDKKVATGNVMFIDSENRRDILAKRIKKITKGLENDGYKKQGEVDFQHYSGFLLDDKSTWKPIVDEIKVLQPSLILLDHLAMFHNQNEDKAPPMTKVAVAVEELMAICDSTLLIMHHFNKNEGSYIKRLRGSTAIYAKSDAAYEVRAISRNKGGLEKIGLIEQPRKEITSLPMRIKIVEGSDWIKVVYDGTYQPVEDPVMDRITHDIFHIFLGNMDERTVKDIEKIVADWASVKEIRDALRECNKRGLLLRMTGAHGKFTYRSSSKEQKCPWCVKP